VGGDPSLAADLAALETRAARLRHFELRLALAGLSASYEAAHARLAVECVETARLRLQRIESGDIKPLDGAREAAADRSYLDASTKLCNGLEAVLKKYETTGDQPKKLIYEAWAKSAR
jgi:hypothetical protein